MSDPTPGSRAGIPLTPLQSAYLAGRDPSLPLGGTPMYEFREYSGTGIDAGRLRDALAALVHRHEVLRLVPDPAAGHSRVLDILHAPAIPVEIVPGPVDGPDATACRFRLRQAPAESGSTSVRVALIGAPADDQRLLVGIDATSVDGAGIGRLLREALHLYRGEDPGAAPRPGRLAEILADLSETEPTAEDTRYWETAVADAPPAPVLPWTADPGRATPSTGGSTDRRRVRATIPAAAWDAAVRGARTHRLFPNAVPAVVTAEVVRTWSEDGSGLRLGVPLGMPTRAADPAGPFSGFTMVALPTTVLPLHRRAERMQRALHTAIAHRTVPGTDLARMLTGGRPDALALPVTFTNALGWGDEGTLGSLRLVDAVSATPQVAVDIRWTRDGDDIAVSVDHAVAVLAEETALALVRAAVDLVHRLGDPATWLHTAPVAAALDLSRRPREAIPVPAPDPARAIHAALTGGDPDAVVLRDGPHAVTRAELAADVAAAAAGLAAHGVNAGDRIALPEPRSRELVAVVLACVVSGITYAPLDPDTPPARLAAVNAVLHPRLTVGSGGDITAAELVRTPGPARPAMPADGIAPVPYVLFTSGSTGLPKGVEATAEGVAAVLAETTRAQGVGPGDTVLAVTRPHHDMSVYDLLGAIPAGAVLALPPTGADRDPRVWARACRESQATVWISVPAMVEAALAAADPGDLASLRLVATGGDRVTGALVGAVRAAAPAARVLSLGGPTETTVWNIWHEITPADGPGPVPYGRPLPGNQYLVLDAAGDHRPDGVPGRMYCTGTGVARGYLGDAEATAANFVTVTDYSGVRVRAFRTGDRGWFRPDGTVMFAGRLDGRMKIRGVLVDPGEVENAVESHPEVASAIAVAAPGPAGDDLLVVYTPATDTARRSTSTGPVVGLTAHVASLLPPGLRPTRFVPVDAIPLSANGKPDRRAVAALPAAIADRDAVAGVVRAALQEVLCLPVLPDLDADLTAVDYRPSRYPRVAAACTALLGGVDPDVANPGPIATPRALADHLLAQSPHRATLVAAAHVAAEIADLDAAELDVLLTAPTPGDAR